MNFSIKKNKVPILEQAKFLVDDQLSKKLNRYELTRFLNCSQSSILLGNPGTGKTSFFYSIFSKHLMNNCFHKIFLFCPPSSQSSIENNKFLALPESQRFDDLTFENLTMVIDEMKNCPVIPDEYENAGELMNYAIIIDDLASRLKSLEIQKEIKDLFMNRRHLHCSLFMISQGLNLIPKPIRNVCKNWFVFTINRNSFLELFEHQVSQITDKKLINKLYNFVYDDDHNFLFICPSKNKFFKNWDEIIGINNIDDRQ